MRRKAAIGAALLACLCVAPSESRSSGQETPKFRAGVALVPITAVVRDSRGRFVHDLTRDDFEVRENTQPRPIVEFRSTNNAPVSLAFLLDTSGSMRDANLTSAKSVINTLVARLNPATDETALFTFDKALREETAFTNEPDVIRRALDKTVAWGLTALYDAIAESAKRLADRRTQRRAVVVITDGVDTSSTITSGDASGLASGVDVPVYVLTVARPRRRLFSSDDTLSNLARWTGGDHIPMHEAERRELAIDGLIAELRQLYFLAIDSAAAPGWYKLEVRTRRKDLRVRARSGYSAVR